MLAQLEGEGDNLDEVELQPIDLGMAALKELGGKWLVNMSNYISDNPHIILNGFIHTGIAGALDCHGIAGALDCQETDDLEVLDDDQEELESDDYMYYSDESDYA